MGSACTILVRLFSRSQSHAKVHYSAEPICFAHFARPEYSVTMKKRLPTRIVLRPIVATKHSGIEHRKHSVTRNKQNWHIHEITRESIRKLEHSRYQILMDYTKNANKQKSIPNTQRRGLGSCEDGRLLKKRQNPFSRDQDQGLDTSPIILAFPGTNVPLNPEFVG